LFIGILTTAVSLFVGCQDNRVAEPVEEVLPQENPKSKGDEYFVPGDKGRHFIEEIKQEGRYYSVLSRREGPSGWCGQEY